MDGLKRGMKMPAPLEIKPEDMDEATIKQRHIMRIPETLEERKTILMSSGDMGKSIREILGVQGLKKYLMIHESQIKFFTDYNVEDEVKLIRSLY
jgi:hypothetical protein